MFLLQKFYSVQRKKNRLKNYRETKYNVKPLCRLNLMMKQTIFLVIRANVSRKQNSSRENHPELAVTIFFLRRVGGSTRQRKGLSLQFPPLPYPLAKKGLILRLLTEVSRYCHF